MRLSQGHWFCVWTIMTSSAKQEVENYCIVVRREPSRGDKRRAQKFGEVWTSCCWDAIGQDNLRKLRVYQLREHRAIIRHISLPSGSCYVPSSVQNEKKKKSKKSVAYSGWTRRPSVVWNVASTRAKIHEFQKRTKFNATLAWLSDRPRNTVGFPVSFGLISPEVLPLDSALGAKPLIPSL